MLSLIAVRETGGSLVKEKRRKQSIWVIYELENEASLVDSSTLTIHMAFGLDFFKKNLGTQLKC